MSAIRVPDLTIRRRTSPSTATPLETHRYTIEKTHAVKSALPDAARDPSRLSFVLQTAPLCPTNVPIQSPVHSRNIGFPSLQLDMSRYEPSSNSGEKERCVTGRVCPGATSGIDLGGADIATRNLEEKEKKVFGKVAREIVVRERMMAGAPRADGQERRTRPVVVTTS